MTGRWNTFTMTVLVLSLTACSGGSGGSGDDGPTSGPDPLLKYAWHLKNTGQAVFSANTGTAGQDIQLSDANTALYTGAGVKILISDDGLESTHEDLKENFLPGFSKNFTKSFPFNSDRTEPIYNNDNHGTAVAGLIAATQDNGRGSHGVAPGAQMCIANFLSAGVAQTTAQMISQASGDFDIFNQSWGSAQSSFFALNSSYESQLLYGVTNGRSGKGSLYIKSAGNDFYVRVPAVANAIRIGNANLDGNNSVPYTIIVAASNALGQSSSYSSPGSNIWVSAPGGEFGGEAGFTDSPAMITTDRTGCQKGYATSVADSVISFEKGSSENSKCNYTATFNGTSSAAPVLSGTLALLLQANPNLTWRDIKHILASTSTQTAMSASIPHQRGVTSPVNHTWEQGWVTNAAGYKFQNWFGFGNLNADAAIAMATSYTVNLGQQLQTRNSSLQWYYSTGTADLALPIPDNSAVGAESTIDVKHNYRIEAVQIKVKATHTNAGQLGVELTSPQGVIRSILLNINNSLDGQSNLNLPVLLTNAFYGESSAGVWTLRVIDGSAGTTGTLNRWDINIIGHVNPDDPDQTVPDAPTGLNHAPNYSAATSMSPSFTFTDSVSPDVLRYEYSIGTSVGATNTRAWTPILSGNSVQASGLTLSNGTTYYINMRAIDHAENISSVISSSGWLAN
ncbi:Microbial serine proteinase precursor [compost metagenome]